MHVILYTRMQRPSQSEGKVFSQMESFLGFPGFPLSSDNYSFSLDFIPLPYVFQSEAELRLLGNFKMDLASLDNFNFYFFSLYAGMILRICGPSDMTQEKKKRGVAAFKGWRQQLTRRQQ